MKNALIVYGGWDGHEPRLVADIYAGILRNEGFAVELSDTLASFEDAESLGAMDLIIPIWTMGMISEKQLKVIVESVAGGAGMAGCHGGMCDAFRDAVDWAFLTGGTWVAHPGGDGVEYTVNIKKGANPLVAGIDDFTVKSEQYYLHVDPAVDVLASTKFPIAPGHHSPNGSVDMPVAWTKYWGQGRVYYNSLGHHADILEMPQVLEMIKRGCLWAASGKGVCQAR
jgi:hypothetical protein